MQTQKIAVMVLAATVFGCLMAVENVLDSAWARALIAGIAGGGLAAAISWIQCRRVMRLPEIAFLVLAAAVFGCLWAVRHDVDSVLARIFVAAIAAGGFAGAVSWIMGRGVKT